MELIAAALSPVLRRATAPNETVTARDLDIVLVPRGYHPVAAAPDDGYDLSVMSGPTRAWHVTLDPDHATEEASR